MIDIQEIRTTDIQEEMFLFLGSKTISLSRYLQ